MGPLVSQGIIDPAWNNVLALLIGFAFGYILEATGFSSSRKLAGVFYGYDFVVLRTFMTAVMVAMVGLMFFDYFGWIDLSMIYILPTFVSSAVIGGVIMGLGFVVGGFCPGTSLCGAVIGKIDAMVFTAGIFIGIFIFSEAFPFFENIYYANDLGAVKINEFFGISAGMFTLIFVVMAIAAFYVTYLIRKKVKDVVY